MKLIKTIVPLLFPFLCMAQDYNASSKSYNTWTAMVAEPGTNNIVVTLNGLTKPGDGGGARQFRWNDTSTKTPVYGMIGQVSGISVGRWEFIYSGGEFNYLWFGAKNDGTTYNSVLQSTIDYLTKNYYGAWLYMPPGNYLDTSHAILKSGINIDAYGAYIINDLPVRSGAGFGYQNPLRLGNMGPSDWDTIVMKSYRYDSIVSGGSKIVMHGMPDSVQPNKIMMIRSSQYWSNAKGLIKPYITRLMMVVKRDGDSAWFEHPIDTIGFSGNFSMELDFKNNGNKVDIWGQLKRWIAYPQIKGLGLKSINGQVALGCMLYQADFKDMYTYGYESISGNGEAWCTFKNLTIDFWKQVAESSIGSHDNVFDGINANWVPRTDGLKPGSKQPFIKFGENVYNITIRNLNVNAGNFNGRVMWFGSATKCKVQNFNIVAKNVRTALITFSTSDQDPDDATDDFNTASIVSDNWVSNGVIVANRANIVQNFIYYYKPITLGKLWNNIVDNVSIYGMPTQNAVLLDGVQPIVRNSWFENGAVGYGDSLKLGSIENSWVPSAVLPINSNINFTSVRVQGDVLNTKLAGDYRPKLLKIAADSTLTTATLTGSGLKLPVAANKYYTLYGTLRTGSTGTNGMAIGFSAPAGASFIGGNITGSNTASNNNAGTAKIAAFGSAAGANFNKFVGNGGLQFQMAFQTGSTAGFIELLFASDGTSFVTIQSNSFISLQENTVYSP